MMVRPEIIALQEHHDPQGLFGTTGASGYRPVSDHIDTDLSHFADGVFRGRSSAVQVHGDQMAAERMIRKKPAPHPQGGLSQENHAPTNESARRPIIESSYAWGSAAFSGRV